MEVPVLMRQGVGITRDVSQTGVYFLTDEKITPGMLLDLTIELAHAIPGETMQLHCQGRVVRVEVLNGKTGVAASIIEFGQAA